MINPIIFTRTRRYLGRAQPGGELLEVAPQPGRGHHLHPGATTVSLASLRRATAAALAITAGRRRRRRPCLVSGGRSLAAGCVQRRGTPPSRLRRRGRLLVRARRRLGPPTTRASTRDGVCPSNGQKRRWARGGGIGRMAVVAPAEPTTLAPPRRSRARAPSLPAPPPRPEPSLPRRPAPPRRWGQRPSLGPARPPRPWLVPRAPSGDEPRQHAVRGPRPAHCAAGQPFTRSALHSADAEGGYARAVGSADTIGGSVVLAAALQGGALTVETC
jgi:hypothetical protein